MVSVLTQQIEIKVLHIYNSQIIFISMTLTLFNIHKSFERQIITRGGILKVHGKCILGKKSLPEFQNCLHPNQLII